MNFTDYLLCPITKKGVKIVHREDFKNYSIPNKIKGLGEISKGLIDVSASIFIRFLMILSFYMNFMLFTLVMIKISGHN